jgi:nucleoside diphosphate kinase
LLDNFIKRQTGLERMERFGALHSRASITTFYSLTSSTGGAHWPLVLDLFDMHPVCVTIWQGPNALFLAQELKGSCQPALARDGSIRARFFCDNPVTNLVHVSDSPDVMRVELEILRMRSIGCDMAAWNLLETGCIAHSSFETLLTVLGNRSSGQSFTTLGEVSAFDHARICYRKAVELAFRQDLTAPVQAYLRGDCAGLEGLSVRAPYLSSWDRLILRAGLFAMPLWSLLFARNSNRKGSKDV